jgi:hypothetical protein
MGNIGNKGRPGRISVFISFVVASLLLLPGCSLFSPKVIEKVVIQHDTTAVHQLDSIFFRDSIWMKEYVKGDTVYVEKYKDRYVYKDKWHDRYIYKEFHDTTTVTVEKEVEKELSSMQKAKIGLFWWLLAGLVGCLGWIFRKPIINLIKTLI